VKAQEVKELTVKIWQYLADNPGIRDKSGLPYDLFRRVMHMHCYCPLCDRFIIKDCIGCPLFTAGHDCKQPKSFYYRWLNSYSGDVKLRRKCAEGIVEIVREWEI
jgi:hypothetical protein